MEEIDIWRTAKLLVEQRGLLAQYDAVVRASELKARGDDAGCAVWVRVSIAVEELWRTERDKEESLH